MPSTKPVLTEGMREGDLCDLVLPLLSVDEYASKIDPKKAIVIGFYVHDQDGANDLNRFLQKSAVPLLDTDVSPAPDQHGYFMVFVELMKDERLPVNVSDILGEIKSLVGVESWQMRVRSLDDLTTFSERNLKKAIRAVSRQEKDANVLEFLQPSALGNALTEDGMLVLEGAGERFVFSIVELDRIDNLLEQHRLTDAALRLDMRTIARSNRLTRILGEGWCASSLGGMFLLHHSDDPRGLLVK